MSVLKLHFFQANCVPQQFEIKCFPLNAGLLSRLFQTGKVQSNRTKCEMARIKQQAFIFRIARVHSSLERRVNVNFNILLHRWTHLSAQNKTAKYFLKFKGHNHNIFSLRIGEDKTGKSVLTSPQHQYHLLHHNHCLSYSFHHLLLCQNHLFSLLYLLDIVTSLYQYVK